MYAGTSYTTNDGLYEQDMWNVNNKTTKETWLMAAVKWDSDLALSEAEVAF